MQRPFALAVLACMIVVFPLGCAADAQEAPQRPNILFVLTDDQMPSTLTYMDNVQSDVIAEGKTFSNTVNAYPLCCPSRAIMQRGQYAHNTRVLGNHAPKGGWEVFKDRKLYRSTVGTWLHAAGYSTGYFGKYMNGYRGGMVPPGWDRWYVFSSKNMGWEEITQEDGSHRFINKVEADSLVSKAALNFIDVHTSTDEPFFAFVSFGAPHTPYPHPPRLDRMYGGVRTPRNAAFNEADVSDKPSWVRQRERFGKREVRTIDGQYRNALRSLVRVDDFVGTATNLLGDRGVLTNTYIFFYTDNGVHTGYHRLGSGKMTPYETDMVFPMAIRGPGIQPGSETQKLTSNVDIAPTMADLAGADVPNFVDGRSLVPLFAGDVPSWRTAAFSEFRRRPLEEGTPKGLPSWYALRTEDHSFVEYSTGETEYYDVENDPINAENLTSTLSSEEKTLFRAKIEAFKNCGAEKVECRSAEGP